MSAYSRSFAPDEELTEDEANHELVTENPPANAEDKNWKDRYGNLRSYTQKQLNDAAAEKKRLQDQIAELTKKQVVLPTSPDQVKEWAQKYPDIAKIVETIAIQKSTEQTEDINRRLEEIREKEVTNSKREAQLKLAAAHPDFFDDIRNREDFHTWLASKSARVQNVIYGDDNDADAAIDVVNMYKLETQVAKQAPRQNSRNAAESVPNGRRIAVPGGENEPHFTESQVAKMSTAEYTKYEEAIDKAIRDGKFDFDISGGAM